jgi:hypothetical protein
MVKHWVGHTTEPSVATCRGPPARCGTGILPAPGVCTFPAQHHPRRSRVAPPHLSGSCPTFSAGHGGYGWPAPKGRNSKAQAEGLGKPAGRDRALNGRNITCHGPPGARRAKSIARPFRAGFKGVPEAQACGLGFGITPLRGCKPASSSSLPPVSSRRYG